MRALLPIAVLAACGSSNDGPITVDVPAEGEVTRTFDVAGAREVRITGDGLVEVFVAGGSIAERPPAQPGPEGWLAPQLVRGERVLEVVADGEVTLTVSGRGEPPPDANKDRSLAWFDAALLDDAAAISFARVMATIASDGHGGALLERWFEAFSAGPGAGRATFAQFLDEVRAQQGADPAAWDLAALPMKVTGIHNRADLAAGEHCGELRVSIASTHPTFTPVHLIFLFRQEPRADDVTPDGYVHCLGSARRWARLSGLDDAAFLAAARALIDEGFTRERFLLAESLELSISPWQWRQWRPDGAGFTNPLLFQTIDVTRVNAPGPLRDAFLADVAANLDAIAARTWPVPDAYKSAVAEVDPNVRAPLVDLAPLAVPPGTERALGVIGCPRCHTEDADFLQTSIDRRPSPFYGRELDARAARLDRLNRAEWPPAVPFGPLQDL